MEIIQITIYFLRGPKYHVQVRVSANFAIGQYEIRMVRKWMPPQIFSKLVLNSYLAYEQG